MMELELETKMEVERTRRGEEAHLRRNSSTKSTCAKFWS